MFGKKPYRPGKTLSHFKTTRKYWPFRWRNFLSFTYTNDRSLLVETQEFLIKRNWLVLHWLVWCLKKTGHPGEASQHCIRKICSLFPNLFRTCPAEQFPLRIYYIAVVGALEWYTQMTGLSIIQSNEGNSVSKVSRSHKWNGRDSKRLTLL